MIRAARPEDFPVVVEMGRRFHDAAGMERLASYDPGSVLETLNELHGGERGILLVAVHDGTVCGMIGGIVYPLYYNRAALTAQEVFWWSESPGLGVRLYEAFEDRARRLGAKSIQMIGLDDMKTVETLYRRLGFAPLERHYVKVL